MGNPCRYWRFVRINAAGSLKTEEVTEAKTFFQKEFPAWVDAPDVPDNRIQSYFIQLVRSPSASIEDKRKAECSLRCFISHQIEQVCIDLENQFGIKGGFSRFDLFEFVLNDVDITQPLPFTNDRSSSYQLVACKILKTFNPDRSSLSTWTRRLAEREESLLAFLAECGIYRESDWAILNRANLKRLRKVLSGNRSAEEIQQICCLLQGYHAIYRNDRLQQKQTLQRCASPTPQQLQRIANYLQSKDIQGYSADRVLSELQKLAQLLRQSRSQTFEPLDERSVEQPAPEPDAASIDVLLTTYFQELLDSLEQAIDQTMNDRIAYLSKKKPPTDQAFLTAMSLFYFQNQSMGKIASAVGLQKQYQVTRLLGLKEFREDVRRRVIERMHDRDRLQALLGDDLNLTRLDSLNRRLDAALSEIIAQAQAEATTAKRSSRSLFVCHLCCRLCHYLYHRSTQL